MTLTSLQKYSLGVKILFLGAAFVALPLLFLEFDIFGWTLTGVGILLLIVGSAMMIHYSSEYRKDLASEKTKKVEDYIKERTGSKIPPPPWLEKEKNKNTRR